MAWWRGWQWWYWALGGAAVAGLAVLGNEVRIMVQRGSRVGPKTTAVPDGSGGVVPDDPRALAAAAGMNLDAYALARAISSEHGRDNVSTKIAIAWAVRNAARADGVTLFRKLTHHDGPADGKFSAQDVHPVKYASTRLDPYEQEAQIASAVVAGTIGDPTSGATNFFSPSAQRAAHARNPTTTKSPEQVTALWESRGLEPVAVAGTDPDTVTFFRRA